MSGGWTTVERKKAILRRKREWLIDLGLVFIYSLFMVGCFFIFVLPKVWGEVSPITWGDLISVLLVMLISPYISFVLNSLKRTLMIFFLSSLLGFALTSAISVALLFHSYTTYSIEISTDTTDTITLSPAQQILTFVIGVFFISILGAITGAYIAERTGKGEKRLTLRCYNCGKWNEQEAIICSYCGKKLNVETEKKTESTFSKKQ